MMAVRFRPGAVVGYLMPSRDNRDGFIVQTKNFRAWGKLSTLKLLPQREWKYVTLTEQIDYGTPIGTLYLSRNGTYFNIKSEQKEIVLMGWAKNLRRFIEGKNKRVSLHQRTTKPPELQPLVFKIKKWSGDRLRYWIGVEGSRYGLTLTYDELTFLLTQMPTSKEHYGKRIVGDLTIAPQPNGTIKIGKIGSQRKLTTTTENLQTLLNQHFITPRIGEKWLPPIPKLQGWTLDTTTKNPITLWKTTLDKYGRQHKAKITLYIHKKTPYPIGGDLIVPYTKNYNLTGYIQTSHTQTGNQLKRWAKRDLRKIVRVMVAVK